MVALGVGTNMVTSVKFWAEALGVLEDREGEVRVTPFGNALLNPERGWDPYLERKETIWALHWRLVHPFGGHLFAWKTIFGSWLQREWDKPQLLREFERLAALESVRSISTVTLERHLDVFLHTYVIPEARRKGRTEDELDCPFRELRLVERAGERRSGISGRIETIYSMRFGAKSELDDRIFAASLVEWWDRYKSNEKTLSFSDIASAPLGVGRVFGLNETNLRDRLERIHTISDGALDFRSSGLVDALHKTKELNSKEWWALAYSSHTAGAARG